MILKLFLFNVALLITFVSIALSNDFKDMLLNAEKVADSAMADLLKSWQVEKYPNFLKSCSMSKHSWDFMKLKFKHKILNAAVSSSKSSDFKVCFGGSSVTAGVFLVISCNHEIIIYF